MDYVFERDWREIFALAAEAKAEKRREERTRQFYEEIDRDRDHKLKVKEKEEKEEKAFEQAMAAEIATFNEHLDAYDTATVHALMDNGEALDRVRDSLRQMEERAFTLPDGRRVFRTSDGKQVFDEHGTAVTADVIDPHAIDDRYPVWEKFRDQTVAKGKLEAERHDLLTFQAKVDAAREKAGEGKVSKRELDSLEADLKANAPPSVRQKLGMGPAGKDADRDRTIEALSPIDRTPAAVIAAKRPLQEFAPQ